MHGRWDFAEAIKGLEMGRFMLDGLGGTLERVGQSVQVREGERMEAEAGALLGHKPRPVDGL